MDDKERERERDRGRETEGERENERVDAIFAIQNQDKISLNSNY